MSNKEKYKIYCNSNSEIPIFSQPWWLDAVCGKDKWDVYLYTKGDSILASCTYFLNSEKTKTIKPIVTQNNGLIINYPINQKIVSRLDYEERVIDNFCDFIETLNLKKYEQQYHYRFTNWLPFFWREYREITRYTYVIDDTSNMENVRNNYSSKIRNKIKKAKNILTVKEIDDKELFYKINKLTFDRQEKEIPYSYDFFSNLYDECKKKNCTKLLYAIDEKNRVHSVAMIVWDNSSVYYLLNGTDPELKQFQGNALLIDKSIEIASNLGKKFDFEGSVIKGIEQSFRQYGGIPKPYFRIFKEF